MERFEQKIPRLFAIRLLLVVALAGVFYFSSACGSNSDPTDGDEDEEKCGYCYIMSGGHCIPDPTCRPDGDTTPDGDASDGDEDGDTQTDGDNQDGDLTDTDEGEGDQADGDGSIDGDTDLDFDVDIDIDEIPEDEEFDADNSTCIPGNDWMCPSGFICNDNGECELGPDEDTDLEGFCSNGQPVCESHADCSFAGDDCSTRAIPCNIDTGCCEPGLPLACDKNVDCPFGMFCSGLKYCDFECRCDDDCNELNSEYCTNIGVCLPFGSDGDTEEDEELPPCTGCDDCIDWFGEGYFCSQDTAECLPVADENGCCRHDQCTAQPNGVCNLHNGQCVYYPDLINRGVIGGVIHVNDQLGAWGVNLYVYLENSVGETLRTIGPLRPQDNGEGYSVGYAFSKLIEGSYNVTLEFEVFPGEVYENPFNPISINYFDPATTIREDIDFYLEMTDPRLAIISGTVHMSQSYQFFGTKIELYRQAPGTHEISFATSVWADDYSNNMRTYSIENIGPGFYLARCVIGHDGIDDLDYYSELIEVEINARNPMQISGIDFYYEMELASLGTVSGTIDYIDPYTADMINVYLYNWPTFPYPVGKAILASNRAGSVGYSFDNIEPGNYWIRAELQYEDQVFYLEPEIGTVDIEEEAGTVVSGIDFVFDQAPAVDGDVDVDLEMEMETELELEPEL
jgi:hypothetical protein